MNTLIRIAFIMLLACGLAVAGSAFKVESAEVAPDGDLQAGASVSVSAVVDFPATSGTTFPTEDTFSCYSELDKPKWIWSVVLGGNENPKPEGFGKFFKISGFELEYPKETSVKLRVTLEGTVPQINTTQNLTVLRFQWLDSSSKVRDTGDNANYLVVRKIVNPQDVARNIEEARRSLQELRTTIDQTTARGVNTTAAEKKYVEAERLLNTATSGNFSSQTSAIERMNALIDEAEKSLEQAEVQAEIDRAKAQIRNVDEMLTFFKANKEISGDPRVAAITVKRESAQQSLTSASDSLSDGNYNQARIRANESATKALEAYNDSVELRSQFVGSSNATGSSNVSTAGSGGIGGGILPYVVVIVVIAVVAIGVVMYQRRNRWDELG
jgi:tetrahydromethanopterin S-methyltransferase subunit F